MRKIEKLSDITINDWLFIKSLTGSEKEVRKKLIEYFNLADLNISESDIFLTNLKDILENKPEEMSLTLKFKYDGVEYGFIPNLKEMKTGEWIDSDDLNDNIVELMSILYRPIVKKGRWFWKNTYEIEKYKESHDKFGDLPVDIYLGASFFFLNLGKTLLEILNIYTLQLQIEVVKKAGVTSLPKPDLQNNTTGTTYSTSQPMSSI